MIRRVIWFNNMSDMANKLNELWTTFGVSMTVDAVLPDPFMPRCIHALLISDNHGWGAFHAMFPTATVIS